MAQAKLTHEALSSEAPRQAIKQAQRAERSTCSAPGRGQWPLNPQDKQLSSRRSHSFPAQPLPHPHRLDLFSHLRGIARRSSRAALARFGDTKASEAKQRHSESPRSRISAVRPRQSLSFKSKREAAKRSQSHPFFSSDFIQCLIEIAAILVSSALCEALLRAAGLRRLPASPSARLAESMRAPWHQSRAQSLKTCLCFLTLSSLSDVDGDVNACRDARTRCSTACKPPPQAVNSHSGPECIQNREILP